MCTKWLFSPHKFAWRELQFIHTTSHHHHLPLYKRKNRPFATKIPARQWKTKKNRPEIWTESREATQLSYLVIDRKDPSLYQFFVVVVVVSVVVVDISWLRWYFLQCCCFGGSCANLYWSKAAHENHTHFSLSLLARKKIIPLLSAVVNFFFCRTRVTHKSDEIWLIRSLYMCNIQS